MWFKEASEGHNFDERTEINHFQWSNEVSIYKCKFISMRGKGVKTRSELSLNNEVTPSKKQFLEEFRLSQFWNGERIDHSFNPYN